MKFTKQLCVTVGDNFVSDWAVRDGAVIQGFTSFNWLRADRWLEGVEGGGRGAEEDGRELADSRRRPDGLSSILEHISNR